ncbi:MRG-domain-containing protein [Chytridium lagenaria]|nr:MRG-domain-containing protein [Chytridium lagenaria]
MSLIFHNNERAKVLKGETWWGRHTRGNGPHYFIHYKGWKQTWDEWVPETRVLKYNDDNLKRQAELHDSLQSKKSKSSDKNQPQISGEKQKRTRDVGEKEEDFLKRPEIKIPISEALKIVLVDDWENITKNQKVANVSEILTNFKEYYQKENKGKEDWKAYFDRALGNLLLYRFERQQYLSMSDVYGAEHLLRLFVQLPQLIAHTHMDAESIAICRDYFVEVIK